MSSKGTSSKVNYTVAKINKFKYYDNTKGSTLVTDASSNVTVVPPGSDDQILVADSSDAKGVKWLTVPSNIYINLTSIVGYNRSFANTSSYSIFSPHTAMSGTLGATDVETQFIYKAQTIVKFHVYPAAGNVSWPNPCNFTFDIGYLKDLAGTGYPNAQSTVSATTNSFVPIAGTTAKANNTYASTRNPVILSLNVAVAGLEYLCIRNTNATSAAAMPIMFDIILQDVV